MTSAGAECRANSDSRIAVVRVRRLEIAGYAWGESKLSYSIDKRAAEMVIYCYLLTTSRQLCDFQAALWRAYLPLSTDVLHQNSGTP